MKKAFKYILAFIWSMVNLIPLIVVVLGSFKNTAGIYLGPFVLPESWNFTNYDTALLRANVLNGIGNSFLYAVLSVTAIVLLASMAGYVLSRHHGRLISGVYIYFVLASWCLCRQRSSRWSPRWPSWAGRTAC